MNQKKDKGSFINLVIAYFAGVDSEDQIQIDATMHKDCIFSVETHGVRLDSRNDIHAMFHRLWQNHASVLHDQFIFTVDPDQNRITAQFRVLNTHHDGSETIKSNCNVFTIKDEKFSQINVYMTGENTLDKS
jgi:hypothetical protein